MDVLIRQAHPGPEVEPYRTMDSKFRDAERYRRDEGIPWTVLVDDLEGSAHQVYGGLADPTYLIDRDGRVAFYNMWTHVPTVHEALTELAARDGRGVVHGGVDNVPHMLSSMVDGWKAIRRGLPQSFVDLETAVPGLATGTWLGWQLRPLLAPVALRAKPLPTAAKAGLAAAALVLVGLGVRRLRRREG